MNDALYQTLLGSLGAPGAGPGLSVQDLLTQAGGGDPRVAAVMKLMAERQAARVGGAESADEPDPDDGARERAREERRERARELHRMMNDMYRELETLRARNGALAAALGACHLCWGDDPACEYCRGRGGPGALRPDRPLFRQYVAPALRRAGPAPEKEVHP